MLIQDPGVNYGRLSTLPLCAAHPSLCWPRTRNSKRLSKSKYSSSNWSIQNFSFGDLRSSDAVGWHQVTSSQVHLCRKGSHLLRHMQSQIWPRGSTSFENSWRLILPSPRSQGTLRDRCQNILLNILETQGAKRNQWGQQTSSDTLAYLMGRIHNNSTVVPQLPPSYQKNTKWYQMHCSSNMSNSTEIKLIPAPD